MRQHPDNANTQTPKNLRATKPFRPAGVTGGGSAQREGSRWWGIRYWAKTKMKGRCQRTVIHRGANNCNSASPHHGQGSSIGAGRRNAARTHGIVVRPTRMMMSRAIATKTDRQSRRRVIHRTSGRLRHRHHARKPRQAGGDHEREGNQKACHSPEHRRNIRPVRRHSKCQGTAPGSKHRTTACQVTGNRSNLRVRPSACRQRQRRRRSGSPA